MNVEKKINISSLCLISSLLTLIKKGLSVLFSIKKHRKTMVFDRTVYKRRFDMGRIASGMSTYQLLNFKNKPVVFCIMLQWLLPY